MLGNLLTLDILGGFDVKGTNCVLKQNKTELLGRGPYDYVQGLRDEMIVNRGYNLPPYHQESWSFKENDFWTPAQLDNLETWFSPEYFHPETNDPTKCVQMENRSTAGIASANAIQNADLMMPTLVTDSSLHRGLTILDFDGASDDMVVDTTTDWNVGADPWFCCVLLMGPGNDTDDKQYVVRKGARWSLAVERSSTNKDVVFDYTDGSTAAALTETGVGTLGSTYPYMFSFGIGATSADIPFLYSRVDTNVKEQLGSAFTGNMSVSSKPRIGSYQSFGTAKRYDGQFIELIQVTDLDQSTTETVQSNIHKVEGYLAHKYRINKDIFNSSHPYYEHPPRLDTKP